MRMISHFPNGYRTRLYFEPYYSYQSAAEEFIESLILCCLCIFSCFTVIERKELED